MKKILSLLSIVVVLMALMSCQPTVGSAPAGKDILTLKAVDTPLGVQIVASYESARSISGRSVARAAATGVIFTSEDVGVVAPKDYTDSVVAVLNPNSGLVTPVNATVTSITVKATATDGTTATIPVDLTPVALANGANVVHHAGDNQVAVMWKFKTGTVDTAGTAITVDQDLLDAIENIRFVWIANCPSGTLNAGFTYLDGLSGSREAWKVVDGTYTAPGAYLDYFVVNGNLSVKAKAGTVLSTALHTGSGPLDPAVDIAGLKAILESVPFAGTPVWE
jgi:hypothetical protein